VPTSSLFRTLEIAVELVADIEAETMSPATDSLAYGLVVPTPMLPLPRMRKKLVVADPLAFVVDATSNSAEVDPYVPCRVNFAHAVEVPSASALFVLSKKNLVASALNPLAPLLNCIAPEIPEEEPPPEERHVPPIEKQPDWRLIPLAKVEDAVVEATYKGLRIESPNSAEGVEEPIPTAPLFATVNCSPRLLSKERIFPVPICVVEASGAEDDAKIESGEYATVPSDFVSRVRRSHWV
jgi:hypothetical protein